MLHHYIFIYTLYDYALFAEFALSLTIEKNLKHFLKLKVNSFPLLITIAHVC